MMVVTSPTPLGPGARRDPADRPAAGRLRPLGAPEARGWRRTRWPQPRPMPASRSARCAPLQAFTAERLGDRPLLAEPSRRLCRGGELDQVRARHPHAFVAIFRDLRVGRGGAVVRLARRAVGRHDGRHAQPVPDLCGDRSRRAGRALARSGATSARRPAPPSASPSCWTEEPGCRRSARPTPPAGAGAGRSRSSDVASPIRRARRAVARRRSSLAIRPGETVAIVGPSGAGKSTLFRSSCASTIRWMGSVSVDGVDLREADPDEVRARLAIVPQDRDDLCCDRARQYRLRPARRQRCRDRGRRHRRPPPTTSSATAEGLRDRSSASAA